MDRPYEFLSRTGDGVCVVDRNQRIVLWNDAARELLGFSATEVLGRPCYDVLCGTDETGRPLCRRDCAVTRAVRLGRRIGPRELRLRQRGLGRTRMSVSTLSLPARWSELSVLAHLFRRVGDTPAESSRSNALAGPARPGLPPRRTVLTARELQVLEQLSRGASTRVICTQLGIATATTRAHVRNILFKLGVHDRLEAVTYGFRAGFLEIPGGPAPATKRNRSDMSPESSA